MRYRSYVSARLMTAGVAAAVLATALAVPTLTPSSATAAPVEDYLLAVDAYNNGRLLGIPLDGSSFDILANDLGFPLDVAVGPDGDYFVATSAGVLRVPEGGGSPTAFARGFGYSTGVAVDADGDVYVADRDAGTVSKVSSDGQTRSTFASFSNEQPSFLEFDPAGNLLVSTFSSGRLYRVATDGTSTLLAGGIPGADDIAVEPDGSILVAAEFAGRIYRVPANGGNPTAVRNASGINPIGVASRTDGSVIAVRGDGAIVALADDNVEGEDVVLNTGGGLPYGLASGSAPSAPSVPQEITFTSEAPEDATVGDTYTPTATGGDSGNDVTFSIANSAAEVCFIDAETSEVYFDAPGTCTIAADQAGGTVGEVEYADAEQVTQDVTVNVPELFITGQVASDSFANEAGWYRTPATIIYTCGGGTAPLDCPDRVTRDNTQPGFKVARKVTDANGNTAKDRTLLQVDTTDPNLKFSGLANGPYDRKARPVDCTAVDRNSGVDGTCVVTYGRVVAGEDGGATRRWTATASDVAGNLTTVSRAFRVKGSAPRSTLPTGTN